MGDEGKKKVVLVGIYYPVAIVRYFEAALRRREDVELFTVGPYTGRQIPWNGGMFIDEPPAPCKAPDVRLPYGHSDVLIDYVANQLPWEPDVWIQVDAAYHLLGKPKKGFSVHVGTDPHCIDYNYNRSVADIFYNMQTPYMKGSDVWLPYAYDPVWHSPIDDAEKIYDFGIVGATGVQGPLYANRDWLVKTLRDRGYNVMQVFGPAYDKYRTLLNQCKVGINWSTREDTTARVFETMGMRVALLTNMTPDLDKLGFVFGADYTGFRSRDEALDRASWLVDDSRRIPGMLPNWQTLGERGAEAVRLHTWDARVERILNDVR